MVKFHLVEKSAKLFIFGILFSHKERFVELRLLTCIQMSRCRKQKRGGGDVKDYDRQMSYDVSDDVMRKSFSFHPYIDLSVRLSAPLFRSIFFLSVCLVPGDSRWSFLNLSDRQTDRQTERSDKCDMHVASSTKCSSQ